MRLKSLSERIIEIRKQHGSKPIKMWSNTFYQNTVMYQDFLNLKVTKGMFVECTEDDDVINWSECGTEGYIDTPYGAYFIEDQDRLAKSKQSILFEGFEIYQPSSDEEVLFIGNKQLGFHVAFKFEDQPWELTVGAKNCTIEKSMLNRPARAVLTKNAQSIAGII